MCANIIPTPPGVGKRESPMNAAHKRDALRRLKTVRGHLDGVIRMVEAEAYCPDLMKQVAAAQASLERVNRILLQKPPGDLRHRGDPGRRRQRQDRRTDRCPSLQRESDRLS